MAVPAALGGVVGLLIVLSLAGVLHRFEVPLAYRATFGAER